MPSLINGVQRIASLLSFLSLLFICLPSSTHGQSEWPQWGGPGRNFVSNSKGLAASWPQTGPKQLWSRALGEGHSAIVVDGNTLYTMYSQGEQESVIALNASTGKAVWEHKYDAPTAGVNYEAGFGPHSTPLLVGDLLYTVGSIGKLHALDKKTGKHVWSQDLERLQAAKDGTRLFMQPTAYKSTIILTLKVTDPRCESKGRQGRGRTKSRHVPDLA